MSKPQPRAQKRAPKLTLKGGRKIMEEQEYEASASQEASTESKQEQSKPDEYQPQEEKKPFTEAELRAAWEKLEGYHPLTEGALGEVLESFLAGRKS